MTAPPRLRWPGVALLTGLLLAACTGGATDEPDPQPPAASEPADERSSPDDRAERQPDPAPDPDPPGPADEPAAQHRAADLPVPRTEVTGTVWDGRIVAVGGLDGDGAALRDVHLYAPDTDAWERGPDLPEGLHHTAVTTLDGRVYVVGGYAIRDGAWIAESSVWSLGPGEDTWRDEPPLATARGALAATATDEQVVAIGGVDRTGQVLTSTEVLTAGAAGWEPGPPLATAREHLDATAVDGEVYAIAGRAGGFTTNHASVEVLRDGAWVAGPALQRSRGGIGATTLAGVPCVTGGEEPAGTIGTVECLVDGSWEVVAALEVPRHGLVVAALGDRLHVVGGGPEPGLTVSGTHEVVPLAPR